jgi:hypothetical protein
LKNKSIGQALTTREAREVYRIIGLTSTMFIIGALVGADDDDRSFMGKLKSRLYREGLTLLQGSDPRLWISVRGLAFLEQVAKLMVAIVTLETYKASGPGYKRGDLKAVNQAKRIVTPAAVRGLTSKEKKSERR